MSINQNVTLKASPLTKVKKCFKNMLCRVTGRHCTYVYCVTGGNFAFIVESPEKITAVEAATRAIESSFRNLGSIDTTNGRSPSIGEFLSVHSSVFERHVFVPSEIVLANAGYYRLAKELRNRLNDRNR